MTLVEWLRERQQNAERIASTKNGAERRGWLEDASYFRSAVEALRWIPVSEYLPPEGVLVAVRDADGDYSYDVYQGGVWEGFADEMERFQEVRCPEMVPGCSPPIVWMALPE